MTHFCHSYGTSSPPPLHFPQKPEAAQNYQVGAERERLWEHKGVGVWGGSTNLCLGGWLAAFLALGGFLLAFLSTGWSGPRFVSFGGLWSLLLRL